VQSNFKGISN